MAQTDLLKEEFSPGLSDPELVQQIQTWRNETEDFYGQLKQVWEQNLLYYKGIQSGIERLVGKQSRAVENRVFMATETLIPIATARLPEIVCRTDASDEVSQMEAQDLQDVLYYHTERLSTQEKAERWIRDLILKRYGVFKVLWDKEGDDVGLRVVDPRRIRIPRYGKTMDELAFVMEELELSYSQAESFFGDKFADQLLKTGTQQSENKLRKSTFLVTETWTNEYVVWTYNQAVLKKQANPFYDFKNKKNNYFDKPRKPYVIKSLFETEESLIGDTDYIQSVISIQDNINSRKRQLENIVSKVANPPLLVDSDVMSEEQVANITNEEGIIIYGKDAANGSKIRFETPGQVSNALFLDLQNSRAEFDNIWGIHSTSRGEREGRETFRGRMLLKQADLGRIDLVARQLERALDEIAEYWTQLIKLFYTEEKSFSILGQDGVRLVEGFSGQKVRPGVKPMVMTGSTLPKDEVSIRQEAIELWQLGAIGIKTLYKRLKFPDIADALQDYVETKSGKILQQGTAQPVPQMPAGASPIALQQLQRSSVGEQAI